jgi:hypothetical protein
MNGFKERLSKYIDAEGKIIYFEVGRREIP